MNKTSAVQSWLRRERMVSAGESGTDDLVHERVAERRGAIHPNLAIGRDRTRAKVGLRRWLCRPIVCAPTVAAALEGSVAGRADPVNPNPCNNAALSRPFAPWANLSWYALAGGGDFESLDWTFQGRAHVVAGSEPYASAGEHGGFSLSLPDGHPSSRR